VELVWNGIEDHIGKGMFRNPPPLPPRGQAGAATGTQLGLTIVVAVVAVFVVLAIFH
jgi:hypothetical protein